MTENGKLYVKNRIIIRFNLKQIFERVANGADCAMRVENEIAQTV